MKQGFGIDVQRLHWVVCVISLLSVIKGYKEGCLFYSVQ